jgi:hypothetical protein
MGSQKIFFSRFFIFIDVIRYPKCIPDISSRVIIGDIEHIKVMLLIFYLRSVLYLEPERNKYILK